MEKSIFRKKARQILTGLSDKQIDAQSLSVSKNIISHIQNNHFKNCTDLNLGAYCPIQQEVLWFKNFDENDYSYSVPHLLDEQNMDFYKVSLEEVSQKKLGLTFQIESRGKSVRPDILLIPGLAFTTSLKRLGRGKGFYDRYLSEFGGVKIGICFEKQLFNDLPTDEHDQCMDYVITEEKVYK